MSGLKSSTVKLFPPCRAILVKCVNTNPLWRFNTLALSFPRYSSSSLCREDFYVREPVADFDPETLRYSDDEVLEMLLCYKRIHGDILVPHAYRIPDGCSDWAEHMHGIQLGILVILIRRNICNTTIRDKLLSMSFIYSPQMTGKGYGYELVKEALQRYKELYGDLLIPASFCVPDSSVAWPQRLWGMKLGYTVTSIRRGKSYALMKEELISVGFDYSPQRAIVFYGYDLVRLALLQYKEWYGDMLVPVQFRIPYEDGKWPAETFGMKLGYVTRSVRSGKCYTDMRGDLSLIGFDFTPQFRGPYGYEAAKVALLNYKELYGDMLVKTKFIIPDEDDEWPCDLWGMKLGQLVSSIRRGKSYVYMKDDLRSIGFNFNSQKTF